MIKFWISIIALGVYSMLLGTKQSIELSLLPSSNDSSHLLQSIIKSDFLLDKLILSSDIEIDTKELKNLLALKEQTIITLQDLYNGCNYLKKKNKFDSVLITLESTHQQNILSLHLKGSWTFFKVKFKGWSLDKNRYEQLYGFESSEFFDIAKHQYFINKIKHELKKDGFLNADIKDSIVYDKTHKRVSVTLSLENMERFTVKKINVQVKALEIDTEELRKIERKLIKILEPLQKNYYEQIISDNYTKEIKAFLAHKGYLNPKVEISKDINKEAKNLALSYTVTLDYKKRFVFFGNHFFSSQQLLDELLVIGSSALLIPPSLLAEDIINLYKKKGFWKIKVEWKEEPDRFYFVINEGPRAKVTSIKVENYPENIDILINKYFNNFLKHDFDEDILNESLENFGNEFIKKGYWDFALKKQDYSLIKDNNYELLLTIELGFQRLLKKITIKDYPYLLNDPYFINFHELKHMLPFDSAIIPEQKQWLAKYFRDIGSLYVSIKHELIEHEDGIELLWHIDKTQNIVFGKTVILGSNKIRSDIILRELQYKEGEPWDKDKIDATVKRLKSLNMFESISLGPYAIAAEENAKPMVLKVVEDDPFEIKTRLGFQQMSTSFTNLAGTTYRIGGSFLWKNPCSRADQLKIDADLTRYTSNAAFSYEIPWTLSYPIRSVYQIYTDRYYQPLSIGCKEHLYKESHDGFSVTVAHAYPQGQASATLGFEVDKLSGLAKHLADIIQFKPALIDKLEPYFYLESSVLWDNFNNKLDPTKGMFTSLFLRGLFPLRERNGFFVKVLLEQSFVYPIYRSILGALRIRLGHIFNAEFSTIMPTERFYLGGATTMRGYETDMVPPLNFFLNRKNEQCWVPVGGKSLVNINLEARFPIYQWLSGALFTDMGVLAQNKLADIQAHKWLGDTGFGLRCNTPIGPIRFDIAWKWKRRDLQDKAYAWFITLGHAF